MKKVLTIAGSDCSGGAGVQADLKTMAAHGVFGMSVIVSVVAENTARVIGIQDISPRMIEEQIDAVFEDIAPDAVKIGMLSSPECMKAVADKLRQYRPANVVIDPVMFAKNGDPLMARITGSGCMSSALLGAFLSIENSLESVAACCAFVGLAGELAAEKTAQAQGGTMTFRLQFIDTISLISSQNEIFLKNKIIIP